MRALFVGRFQPVHRGHAEILKKISEKVDEIAIVIGSSQFANTEENPFSADEREEMLKRVLAEYGIENFRIYKVPDVNDNKKWVENVIGKVGNFDVVYSGNELVKKLFREAGKKVIAIEHINRDTLSGTEIRRRIKKGLPWQNLVPKSAYNYILEIRGEKRIRKL